MPRVRFLLAASAVLLGVTFVPGAAQEPRLTVPYTMDTLTNGLRFIVHEDHSVPIVAMNVWYHVGSGDEKPGRTGFAHLFEHLMFMGSQHAPYPAFDRLLEAAGTNNNGSTTEDRTNYYEWGPSNAAPLMAWLEADRMGYFLPTMDQEKVDLQRDVVQNERRQGVDNQPYGKASETIGRMLYPPSHPYSWPVIGSMADLSAATLEDTREFFRTYYAPNNAVIVVAGDVTPEAVGTLMQHYFGDIPAGPAITRPAPPSFTVPHDTLAVLEDRVQLPRVYYTWHTTRAYTPEDAALDVVAYILAGAKNSRLTQQLVYEDQVASDVVAYQDGKLLDGDFTIRATARPGHDLPELHRLIREIVGGLAADGPAARELRQAQNAIEASFLNRLERVLAKANQLNSYYYFTGNPDYFAQDLARYRAVTSDDVRRAAATYLLAPKVVLSVVPEGKRELAIETTEVTP